MSTEINDWSYLSLYFLRYHRHHFRLRRSDFSSICQRLHQLPSWACLQTLKRGLTFVAALLVMAQRESSARFFLKVYRCILSFNFINCHSAFKSIVHFNFDQLDSTPDFTFRVQRVNQSSFIDFVNSPHLFHFSKVIHSIENSHFKPANFTAG